MKSTCWGGVVKNYLLRNEREYYDEFQQQYAETLCYIHIYQILDNIKDKELKALGTVESTYSQYDGVMITIRELREMGLDFDEIDRFVKIDGKPALALLQKNCVRIF